MAEWSKALRSGRSPLLWAWVRIPLLTKYFWEFALFDGNKTLSSCYFLWSWSNGSRVAQWKRAGPITQRSVDRNYALLRFQKVFSRVRPFIVGYRLNKFWYAFISLWWLPPSFVLIRGYEGLSIMYFDDLFWFWISFFIGYLYNW